MTGMKQAYCNDGDEASNGGQQKYTSAHNSTTKVSEIHTINVSLIQRMTSIMTV